MARAKELLDLITAPTALATGVLIVFARRRLVANDTGVTDRPGTWWALAASVLACVITGTVVAVMSPLFIRVLVTNQGNPIETRLLVYVLTYAVAIGTTAYCGWAVHTCLRHLKLINPRPSRAKVTTPPGGQQ